MTHESLERIYTSSYFETFPTTLRLDQQYLTNSANMLDALLFSRSCGASDPRDKVFGLLGLVSTKDRPPANYSMSTAEPYTHIAMYLLKIQRLGLDLILGNLCYRSDEARAQTRSLPSWVPDWSQCEPTFLQRLPLEGLRFLRAQDPILEYNDAQGLFLEGQIIGTLKTLEDVVGATDGVSAKPLVELENLHAVDLEKLVAIGLLGCSVGVAGILGVVIGSPGHGVSTHEVGRGVGLVYAAPRVVHDSVHSGS